MTLLLIFIFGTIIGSFLSVVVDRLPYNQTIFFGRSHCDHCKKKLSPWSMIPVLSYLYLGGKCSMCKKEISPFYPFIELITGMSFVLTTITFGFDGIALFYYLCIVSLLLVIFFTDFKYGIIPLPIIIFSIILTLFFQSFFIPESMTNTLLSAFGAFVFFLILFWGTKGKGIGFGDVLYVVFMGLLLGFPNIILGFYIAFISGALVGIALILLKKKHFKGSTIPFGPFLTFGTFISLLYGNMIVSTILSFFAL